ncbi:Ribosomal protein L15e [mine drainage metagenome]|uniref:Ribosomal protein L15e n=1 Tax=mine drainage metagenome TaxID=410659 RepID=T0ZRD0_9ZZZZ
MHMGAYKNIRETLIAEYKARDDLYKKKMAEWSGDRTVARIEKPSNIPRARELGYKAKEGVLMARVKVVKGKRKRPKADGGRKPSKSGRFYARMKSLQSIAEERAARRFPNCEVVNSYSVGQSGTHSFYEVILADRQSASLKKDSYYKNITSKRGRAFRGITSSGRKHKQK